MEGDQEDSLTPFWPQSSDSIRLADHRRRRLSRSSSLFFNSGAVLIALIVTALAFIFVIIPSFLSFTSQIFRPHSVKKSWDSLNLVLVLFAIVCGFLSRNSTENTSSNHDDQRVSNEGGQKSNPSTPHQWYEYSDRTRSDSFNYRIYRRMRSSSSHPDLRQESSWVSRDEQWRFYDDTHVANYRPSDSDQHHHQLQYRRRPWNEPEEEIQLETKKIEVDTFEVRAKEDSQPSAPPPPPSPPLPPHPSPPKEEEIRRKPKRKEESRDQSPESKDFYKVNYYKPPPERPPPPPPPPPPVPVYEETEKKSSGKSQEKRRGNATKEFLTSLRKKKKKQRQMSVELSDSFLASIDPPYLPSYPPPPPPLPPPPSVFHTLFSSKKGKTKKVHSFSQSPSSPPPPPPPPPSVRVSKSKAQSRPIPVTQKPSLPVHTSNVDSVEENRKIGSESPLIPIPPPPPPPPFRVQEWRFVRHGDFVRIKSENSSRSGSPELDGGDDSPVRGASPLAVTEGGMSPARMFCPSPDVDTKADNFIARFRAGLILEKENSIKERDRGKSRLGPGANLGREQ